MDSMVFVGTKIDKTARVEITTFIREVFKAGKEFDMTGKTVRHALDLFTKSVEPKNITLSNCNFTGSGVKKT